MNCRTVNFALVNEATLAQPVHQKYQQGLPARVELGALSTVRVLIAPSCSGNTPLASLPDKQSTKASQQSMLGS